MLRRGWRTLAGSHMASIDEERKAAEATKAALYKLSPVLVLLSEEVRLTLRDAIGAATRTTFFSSEGRPLVGARHEVVVALSELIHGPPTHAKIDKAKAAVEDWINQLGKA
jgi:hypothetical protein